jgi:hypothetical protein
MQSGRTWESIEDADRTHERIFGSKWPLPGLYAERFALHEAAVRHVCLDRQLLAFDAKQGWGPLCEFLGVAVPEAAFPWENRLATSESPYQGLWLL